MKIMLHFAMFLCFLLTACGDDSSAAEPPPRGSVLVSVLDQEGQPFDLNHCVLGYDFYDIVGTQYQFEEELGSYSAHIECGKLSGRIDFDILVEGENPEHETRIVGSFCSDGQEFVIDPTHPVVSLQDHLGLSTATRCANWFGYPEIDETSIRALSLDCTSQSDCNPIDARDYLEVRGEHGDSLDGKPLHLSLQGQFSHMADDEEVTILVTIRHDPHNEQEFDIPIVVRNSP